MDEKKKATRRRGTILEDAILRATMEELSETGYQNLTMEKVAGRAKTNKTVLYRRWPNKAALVSAALHKFLSHVMQEIPNTGNLRTDVLRHLHSLVTPLREIGSSTVRGLMLEQFNDGFLASAPQIIRPGPDDILSSAIMEMLRNAELRNELKTEKLSMRIIALPVDLVRYELVTRLELITSEVIEEIVDDIFLPLVYAQQRED